MMLWFGILLIIPVSFVTREIVLAIQLDNEVD
ncbi:hypothetical protein JOD21_003873 [Jeotgalibacillus terrae]|nr:hypothetical protein [Jeotgalibacillus terrae]